MNLPSLFPIYDQYKPRVPVYHLTPGLPGCIHRFFDTSPISPSGRYLALTQLPTEERPPTPGETAGIWLIDLANGESREIARTNAFDSQLGAQVQWGRNDNELYFNTVDEESWRVRAVCLNPETGERRKLGGPVYMASRDGEALASPCLLRAGVGQGGYGVASPLEKLPLNPHAARSDGIYVTDTKSGECRLLASFQRIVEETGGALVGEPYTHGAFYGFHVKWNRQGTRLMFVIRYRYFEDPGRRLADIITMNRDGTDIRLALSWRVWSRGGHHPDWSPDGDHINMNLKLDDQGPLRFVRFRYDGADLEALGAAHGSGHPTLHPDGRHILTDTYVEEPMAYGDGTTPIRWIDLEDTSEEVLLRLPSLPKTTGHHNLLRVDPHPAWDRSYRYVTLNGCLEGRRHVFLADLSSLLASNGRRKGS